jgi:hypothetical protein
MMFGRARSAPELDVGQSVYDELLDWTLAPTDRGKIAIDKVFSFARVGRLEEASVVGVNALAKLGVELPDQPSLVWALWNFFRGRLATRHLDRERLIKMAEAPDDATRSLMELMALTAYLCLTSSMANLGIGLGGKHARLLMRHGLHDLVAVGLTAVINCLFGMRKVDDAFALYDTLAAYEQVRSLGAIERATIKLTHSWTAPYRLPFVDLVTDIDQCHRYCRELEQHQLSAVVCAVGATIYCDAGFVLQEAVKLIEQIEAREGPTLGTGYRQMTAGSLAVCRAFIEGPARQPPPDPRGFESAIGRSSFMVRSIWIDVMFGEFERAEAAMDELARGYESKLLGNWLIPTYAALSVIVMIECWPQRSRRQRRGLRRIALRRRASIDRFVQHCPKNFAGLAALIDAELTALDGQFEMTMRAYEAARSSAMDSGILWLAGLVSTRLGVQARRRGHEMMATAAWTAARESYEAWGAHALVEHVDTLASAKPDR